MAIIVVQAKNMQKWYISGDDFNLEEASFRSLRNPSKDSTWYLSLFMDSIRKWRIPIMLEMGQIIQWVIPLQYCFFYLEGVGTLCSSCTEAKFKRPSIWVLKSSVFPKFHPHFPTSPESQTKPHFTDDFNWGGPFPCINVSFSIIIWL